MPDTITELAKRGRSVDPKDRERLVDLLLLAEAPDASIEEAWPIEIGRRVAECERGEAALHDAEEALVEAKRLAP